MRRPFSSIHQSARYDAILPIYGARSCGQRRPTPLRVALLEAVRVEVGVGEIGGGADVRKTVILDFAAVGFLRDDHHREVCGRRIGLRVEVNRLLAALG